MIIPPSNITHITHLEVDEITGTNADRISVVHTPQGMLYGVACLVCGYCCSRHAVGAIYRLAQVNCLVQRIVVVRQLPPLTDITCTS